MPALRTFWATVARSHTDLHPPMPSLQLCGTICPGSGLAASASEGATKNSMAKSTVTCTARLRTMESVYHEKTLVRRAGLEPAEPEGTTFTASRNCRYT